MAPWSFWKRIELHHAVCVKRLWLWLPLLLVSVYLAMAAVIVGAGAVTVFASSRPAPTTNYAFAKQSNQSTSITAAVSADQSQIELMSAAWPSGIVVAMPTAASSPDFHSTPVGNVLVVWREQLGAWTRTIENVQMTPTWQYREIFTSPSGQVFDDLIVVGIYQPMAWSTPSVADAMIGPLLTPLSIRLPGVDDILEEFLSVGGVNAAIVAIWGLVGFTTLATVIVLVCPSEWRRASVRPAHLVRIAVLSFAPAAVIALATSVAFAWAHVAIAVWHARGGGIFYPGQRSTPFSGGPPEWLAAFMDDRLAPFILIGLVIWSSAYWWIALARGVQLRKPIQLWIFVTFTGILGLMAVIAVVDYFQWML